MFFVFDLPDVEEDAQFVQGQYFPDFHLDDLDITKVTRLRQQRVILRTPPTVYAMLSSVGPWPTKHNKRPGFQQSPSLSSESSCTI